MSELVSTQVMCHALKTISDAREAIRAGKFIPFWRYELEALGYGYDLNVVYLAFKFDENMKPVPDTIVYSDVNSEYNNEKDYNAALSRAAQILRQCGF